MSFVARMESAPVSGRTITTPFVVRACFPGTAHISVLICQSISGLTLWPTAYRLFVQLTQAAHRHHHRSEKQLAAVKALRGGIGGSLTGLSEICQRFNRKFSEKLLQDAFTNFTTTSRWHSSPDAVSHVTSEAAQRG